VRLFRSLFTIYVDKPYGCDSDSHDHDQPNVKSKNFFGHCGHGLAKRQHSARNLKMKTPTRLSCRAPGDRDESRDQAQEDYRFEDIVGRHLIPAFFRLHGRSG
jgi:hypothetical protein